MDGCWPESRFRSPANAADTRTAVAAPDGGELRKPKLRRCRLRTHPSSSPSSNGAPQTEEREQPAEQRILRRHPALEHPADDSRVGSTDQNSIPRIARTARFPWPNAACPGLELAGIGRLHVDVVGLKETPHWVRRCGQPSACQSFATKYVGELVVNVRLRYWDQRGAALTVPERGQEHHEHRD